MMQYCKFCFSNPCHCDTYLVKDEELTSWENSDGTYLNIRDARRLIATVRSLREKYEPHLVKQI